MPIAAGRRRSPVYTGNGVTRQFDAPFRVLSTRDVRVFVKDLENNVRELTWGVDYTVSIPQADTSAIVHLSNPLPNGHKLLIIGGAPYEQPTAFSDASTIRPSTLTRALDRLAIQVQQLDDRVTEAVVRPPFAAADTTPRVLLGDGTAPLANHAIPRTGGGQLTGQVELTAAPTSPQHLATKGYVDSQDALLVPRTGNVTVTGQITMTAAPTNDQHLATKGYVDTRVQQGGSGGGLPDAPSDGVAYVRRNAGWVSADARYVGLLPSAAAIPAGTTAQRPASPPAGATRWNTTTGLLEVYGGTSWIGIGAGGEDRLRWADTAADLGGGSGFTWPGLYRRTGANSWAFEPRLNPGLAYRHLPAPSGGGPANADPWSPVHVFGSAAPHTSLSAANLNLNAGKVLITVFTARDASPPPVASVTHPALSNFVTRDGRPTLDGTSWKGRVTVIEANCSGGAGTLTVNLEAESWVTICHVRHVAAGQIGAFLGVAQSNHVTNVPNVSVSRTGGSPKVDLALVHGLNSVENAIFNVSRDEASLQRGNISPWIRAASTSGANNIDDVQQTFSISTGQIAAGRAVILQWAGPGGSGGSADYTVTLDDLGKKLICQPGTTNVTLPVLTLPNGTDTNGQTGIEHFLAVEVPPNATLNLIRGTGASFWKGPNSGNVAGATVTSNATQRKLIGLITRHDGLWQIVSGEVD